MKKINQIGLSELVLPGIFILWAEGFFAPDGSNLNSPIPRRTMYSSYMDFAGNSHENKVTRCNFKMHIIKFCLCRGFDFNTQCPLRDGFSYNSSDQGSVGLPFIGCDDKRYGTEYFTVSKNMLEPVDIF